MPDGFFIKQKLTVNICIRFMSRSFFHKFNSIWYNVDRYYTSAAWHPERSGHVRRTWYNTDRYYTAPHGIRSGAAMSEGHGIMSTDIIPEIPRRGHVRRTWYNVDRRNTAPGRSRPKENTLLPDHLPGHPQK